MPDLIFILFFFALGACVGSFLNVVVWRLPRNESIVSPPSRCPYCEHRLAWYDNLPVVGWLALRGRCRYCFNPISARYPTVEFLTGLMFVLVYVMFFMAHQGPCWIEFRPNSEMGPAMYHFGLHDVSEDWPTYLLALFVLSSLLAASLIDARFYFIPMGIPILMAIVGVVWHTILDHPRGAMSLSIEYNGVLVVLAVGGAIGLVASNLLLLKGTMIRSFAEGYPALEIETQPILDEPPGRLSLAIERMIDSDRSRLTPEQRKIMEQHKLAAAARERKQELELKQAMKESQPPSKEFSRADIRREMGREIVFLLPPLIGSLAAGSMVLYIPSIARFWQNALLNDHVLGGLAGSLLGALAGGFIIWLIRIFGSIGFGREAMGMGDVHLLFGIGACIGAAGAVVVFFIAPFVGLLFALYKWLFKRGHEIPYGPYLGLACGIVLLFYCRIIGYLAPGVEGLIMVLRQRLHG